MATVAVAPSLILQAVCIYVHEHDVLEALVLLADEVLDGNLHIFVSNVRCARRPHSGALHLRRLHARTALDQKQRHAAHALAASPHSDTEEICEHTVGDP